jgi:hypothetical protein
MSTETGRLAGKVALITGTGGANIVVDGGLTTLG